MHNTLALMYIQIHGKAYMWIYLQCNPGGTLEPRFFATLSTELIYINLIIQLRLKLISTPPLKHGLVITDLLKLHSL